MQQAKTRWIRLRFAALGCLCSMCGVTDVQAEEPSDPLLLLPVATETDLAPLFEVTGAVEAELERQGVAVLSPSAAQPRVALLSEEPREWTEDDSQSFASEANEALNAAADRDWRGALQHLQKALATADHALESANRNNHTAQRIFQACLLAVQMHAELGDRVAAVRQALECRARSPLLEVPAKSGDYQSTAGALMLEAEKRSIDARPGAIVIETAGASCPVFVNGRRLGETPFTYQPPMRQEYRFQVECGASPGRVHRYTPSGSSHTITVDEAYEAALDTRSNALNLHYAKREEAAARRHARLLLKGLHLPRSVLVARSNTRQWALERVMPSGPPRTETLSETYADEELAHALRRLLVDDATTDAEESTPSDDAPLPDAALHRPRSRSRRGLPVWAKGVGIGIIAIGAGLTVASFVAHGDQTGLSARFFMTDPDDDPYYGRGKAWSDARGLPYALGSTGSGLMSAGALGLTFAAQDRALSWWVAGPVGALGTGLVTAGIAQIVRGGACDAGGGQDRRLCAAGRDTRDLGALLVLAGAPALLTLVAKAVHPADRYRRRTGWHLAPEVGRSAWGLRLHADF
ncbi:MAG TPA: hypothetical protein VFX59_06085 [Polyangiales bacterium]|nr:hypothetical protein [Polyangiales bacterium]